MNTASLLAPAVALLPLALFAALPAAPARTAAPLAVPLTAAPRGDECCAGGHAPAGPAVEPPRAAPTDWDVTKSFGPKRDVTIDTDEGTWMQVDVSPDGQTLVFDLLGDLFTLPIGGGDATPLLTGAAFEWQPRFSPDGARIAFVSDRGGADNVWSCARDGSDLRQVTKEDFRLVHCPEWTPDGEWIVVRKHFTHTRSLGAGELWMVHANGGGAGVQLTEKASNTADLNEPAFSKDGRWLWFSHAGDFDYNKNPYQGIYAVSRIDRLTGQREPFSDGSGGACRPRPSPDGKSVAMVRRAGLKTALFVRDLESGRERLLFDGLDHDTMETWSTHGTFPGYCWLPDSSAIVVTAGGKFVRIDAASGAATPIPFRARATHVVHDALRFARPVFEETVHAKMIRWPLLSPDGTTAWFQALGQLWKQPLAGGAATPIALDASHGFACAPALSADGRWLAYTTWQDDVGGKLWLAQSDGSAAARLLLAQPGIVANPAFSPAGDKLAFALGSDGVARGESLAGDTLRIAWLAIGAAAGDAPADRTPHDVGPVTNRGTNRRMARLFFAPGGEQLLWFEDGGAGTVLVRATLDGREKIVLATNEDAEEIAPSPDLKWIAWKEQHQIYVAPFPSAIGRTLAIGRNGAPMPVKKLSDIGGAWPTWSADSRHLAWTLGPQLAIQEIAPLFAPEVAKSAEPPAEPPSDAPAAAKPAEFTAAGVRPDARVVALDASVKGDAPQGRFAVVGARIVTMRGDEVIEDGTLVIDGARIVAVGPRATTAVPAGATVVDGRGKTVMPGLIDVHAHLHYNALDVLPTQPWEYLVNLAYGVTTTHDPSAATELVFAQSELVKSGRMVGPRIYSTGYILYGAKSANKAEIDSLDDARRHLKRLKAVGAFSVKSYNQPRRNQRQWVVAAAREEQMLVVPEGGSLLAHNLTHCLDGHTGVEHNLPVAPIYRDVATLFGNSDCGITPTLIVTYGGLNGEYWWYQHDRVFEKQPLLSLTPPGWLDAKARRRDVFAFDDDFQHVKVAEACAKILRAGGHLQLGAHGQLQGLGAHWELWMLGQGGLTPLEAIRCATHYGAWYLGLDGEIGSLDAGKLADFVVLDKNPLESLQNSDSVELTCKNGHLYDARTMAQQLPSTQPRPRFAWER